MSRILVNAVSAKFGGARTIVESFINAAIEFPRHEFVVFAGFEKRADLPPNITWLCRPKSGAAAVAFSLIEVAFWFSYYRADFLLSFNNINTPLVAARRRATYFHQLKALDPAFREAKLALMRFYLRHSKDLLILQSSEVETAFIRVFGSRARERIVIWPGIIVPHGRRETLRDPRRILVPISSPQSQHKNFAFVVEVANRLGSDWLVVVTAPLDSVAHGLICSNVNFIGTMTRDELFDEYRRATVCLVSSTHETVGLPVFESLAVGTPVVGFDAPYLRAFQIQFGISQGLTIAATPSDAVARIRAISDNPANSITSTRDFCQGDWKHLLAKLKVAQ